MLKENQKKELLLLKDLGMLCKSSTSKNKFRYGLFRCFCGNEFETRIQSVKMNVTKSCGCSKNKLISKSKVTHGFKKHRLYNTWNQMIQRCNNKNSINYKHYGVRGINVCSEWLNVQSFISDMYPSYQEGLTLDRIDNNKGYSKDNCRWSDLSDQHSNTRVIYSHNTSGYRGVSFNKINKKWISYISVDKVQKYLGSYKNKEEAAIAYNKYIIEHNLKHPKNFMKQCLDK